MLKDKMYLCTGIFGHNISLFKQVEKITKAAEVFYPYAHDSKIIRRCYLV